MTVTCDYLRDGREHDLEVRFLAQDLFVLEGLTLDAIAERVPASRSTLARWSSEQDWMDQREQYRAAQSSIRLNEVLARERLIKAIVEKGNPMAAFGYSSLEGTRQRARELALKERQAAAAQDDQALPQITTLEDAAPILTEALQRKMAQILADPSALNLAALRDLAKGFEFVGTLTACDVEEAGKRGISPERAEEIRLEILGKI